MQPNENIPSLKEDLIKWAKDTVLDPTFNTVDYMLDGTLQIGIAVLGDEACHGIHMAYDMVENWLGCYVDFDDDDDPLDDEDDEEPNHWDVLEAMANLISDEVNQEFEQETGFYPGFSFGTSEQGDYLAMIIIALEDLKKLVKFLKKF